MLGWCRSCSFPVGAAVAGPLADAFGATVAMEIYAVLGIAPCLIVLAFPSVRAVRRREAPPEDEAGPATADGVDAEEALAPAAYGLAPAGGRFPAS